MLNQLLSHKPLVTRARFTLLALPALVYISVHLSSCQSNSSPPNSNPVVVFETNIGNFEITLFADKTPITVKNFLSYVNEGFYTDVIFHRVIDNFMIQGGGFSKDMGKKQVKGMIKNEASAELNNSFGTVAMARTGDPDSATSQFFINVKENTFLNHKDDSARGMGYCVFGEISNGVATIKKMQSVTTLCPSRGQGACPPGKLPPGMRDVPEQPIVILKAYKK